MKFPVPAPRVTHTGFAVMTDGPSEISVDSVVVRRFDDATATSFTTDMSKREARSFRRIVRLADLEVGPAYLASAEDGAPILAALRIPGGPKTAENRRSHFGRAMPLVGEREHFLAEVWVAKSVTPAGISAALGALAFLDPPATLARTVILVAEPSRRRSASNSSLLSALAGSGFTPYIHCVSQFNWKRPWRRRIDWIGPPPPARSVLSSTGVPGGTSVAHATAAASSSRGTDSGKPLAMPTTLTQEVTP